MLDPAVEASAIDVDDEAYPLVEGDRQRLVRVSVPASVPPNRFSATAAKVS